MKTTTDEIRKIVKKSFEYYEETKYDFENYGIDYFNAETLLEEYKKLLDILNSLIVEYIMSLIKCRRFNFKNIHLRVVRCSIGFGIYLWDGERDLVSEMYPRMFQITMFKRLSKKVYLDISVKNGHYFYLQLFNLNITTWSS